MITISDRPRLTDLVRHERKRVLETISTATIQEFENRIRTINIINFKLFRMYGATE